MISQHNSKSITVELLAVDLDTCGRCTGTAEHLAQALALTTPALASLGVSVETAETICTTANEARKARLRSSPTIRIDGTDIEPANAETPCEASACCDPHGVPIACRVWTYQGEAHHAAPVGLIVERILQAAVGRPFSTRTGSTHSDPAPYKLPANLERFYGEQAEPGACCPPEELATCCEAGDRAECCGAEATAGGECGCR